MPGSPAPRYDGCRPASALASQVKRRNGKTGTRAEMELRRALWALGIRYRLHLKGLPGVPDLALTRARIAVFVDGDFWHGRDWERRQRRLAEGANPGYWVAKIAYNRERDRRNDALLAGLGWRVLRLWETDILKDPQAAARRVADLLARPGPPAEPTPSSKNSGRAANERK
jgi:DNA mismatch endonuclease (patch repair protein)